MSIFTYFRETKDELRHVNWPSRKVALLHAFGVIAISAIVAYVLGFFDFIFSSGLQKLITY